MCSNDHELQENQDGGGMMQYIDLGETKVHRYLVESESVEGASYLVTNTDGVWECSCPHHQKRKVICKHLEDFQ